MLGAVLEKKKWRAHRSASVPGILAKGNRSETGDEEFEGVVESLRLGLRNRRIFDRRRRI
jgi:hypothetical protein